MTHKLLVGLLAIVMLTSVTTYAQEDPAGDRGGEDDPAATKGKQGKHGRYHALLIGVSEYRDASLNLRGPKNDVERIGRILVNSCGFLPKNVTALTNEGATKQAISERIRAYQGKLKSDDHLLIWYAGHGEKGLVKKEDGFWLPYDARRGRENEPTWLRFDTVLKEIDSIKSGGKILLVSDSCFAGGLTAGSKTGRANTLVLTSGQLQKVDDVYAGGNSEFALRFYEALQNLDVQAKDHNRFTMTIGDVYQKVRNLKHGPWFGTRRGNVPSKAEQFVFVHAASIIDPKEATAGMNRQVKAGFDTRQADGVTVYVPRPENRPKDSREMVLVPATAVVVAGREHVVAPFLIDRTEVTVEMFRKFLNENGQLQGMRYWNEVGYRDNRQPVVGITFEHARAYARWASKDIPNEAEWQAAAAGVAAISKKRKWKWQPFAPPVGSADKKDLSRFGVLDLRGGVREWCRNMRGLQGKAVLKGWSAVAAHSRERANFRWKPTWAEVIAADVPRNNVGFRCVVRWRRK